MAKFTPTTIAILISIGLVLISSSIVIYSVFGTIAAQKYRNVVICGVTGVVDEGESSNWEITWNVTFVGRKHRSKCIDGPTTMVVMVKTYKSETLASLAYNNMYYIQQVDAIYCDSCPINKKFMLSRITIEEALCIILGSVLLGGGLGCIIMAVMHIIN